MKRCVIIGGAEIENYRLIAGYLRAVSYTHLDVYKRQRKNHMEYMPGMEVINSDIREQVMSRVNAYDYDRYTADDVRACLLYTSRCV